MIVRLLIVCFLLSACGPGLIPCPVEETVKYRQPSEKRKPTPNYTAKAEEDPKTPYTKTSKTNDRFIGNVSIEEWDCPKPGEKKYMPRKIRQNIRKNWKKINAPDSLQSSRTR